MTPEQAATLRWFSQKEFKHPELVLYSAAVFLDDVRQLYGAPLYITADARTLEENNALLTSGAKPNSLHLAGRAFDLRFPPTGEALWQLVKAIQTVAGARPVELELVSGPGDSHVHVGLRDHGASRLVLALT